MAIAIIILALAAAGVCIAGHFQAKRLQTGLAVFEKELLDLEQVLDQAKTSARGQVKNFMAAVKRVRGETIPRITFLPQNVTVEAPLPKKVFRVAEEVKLKISTACGGDGQCGLCIVDVVEGMEHLNTLTAIEREYFINDLRPGQRLSCQIHPVDGDVTVKIPEI